MGSGDPVEDSIVLQKSFAAKSAHRFIGSSIQRLI
jgi:hypothetical protein